MSNIRKERVSRYAAPKKDSKAHTFFIGWTDFAEGRSYSPDYDKAAYPVQRNYELGRSYAAAVKGAQGNVPRLRADWDLGKQLRRVLSPALQAEINFHMKDAK